MKTFFPLISVALAAASVTISSCRTPARNPAAPRSLANIEEIPLGPIDDCLQNSFLYAQLHGLEAECTANYVHYLPAAGVQSAQKEKIRIGSFNLFHLGDNQTPLKNFTLVAKIINQWDVVGVQELMPLPRETSAANRLITIALTQQTGTLYPNDWRVESPGYLKLLGELRKLDPAWALILQAHPDGEGSAGEMSGFYYRSSAVTAKEWSYCPADGALELKAQKPTRNLACLTQVAANQRPLISRTAFAAYFQAGNFDFVGLTAHVRFRPAKLKEELDQQQQEVCAAFPGNGPCKPATDVVGRYYEVKAVADQIESIQTAANDKDIIYMGDFNLEYNAKTKALWEASLKNSGGSRICRRLS